MSFARASSAPVPSTRWLALRVLLVVLVVAVAAFSSSDPYLEGLGLCGHGGCPEASHASHAGTSAGFSAACLAAVLVASGAGAFGFVGSSGRLLAADHRRPAEAYLSLDTPPPRFLTGH